MQTKEISSDMQMQSIQEVYPGATRALFQKYHIGGCSSCGFQPSDTLEQVLKSHGQENESENAIQWIYESAKIDEEMQISATELKSELDNGIEWALLDIRDDYEAENASIEGSTQMDSEIAEQILNEWPKDKKIVFICHHGIRSLNAASYFKGHGIENVKSLKGGIDNWSVEIDNSIQRY